jgi:hypothetical protein
MGNSAFRLTSRSRSVLANRDGICHRLDDGSTWPIHQPIRYRLRHWLRAVAFLARLAGRVAVGAPSSPASMFLFSCSADGPWKGQALFS